MNTKRLVQMLVLAAAASACGPDVLVTREARFADDSQTQVAYVETVSEDRRGPLCINIGGNCNQPSWSPVTHRFFVSELIDGAMPEGEAITDEMDLGLHGTFFYMRSAGYVLANELGEGGSAMLHRLDGGTDVIPVPEGLRVASVLPSRDGETVVMVNRLADPNRNLERRYSFFDARTLALRSEALGPVGEEVWSDDGQFLVEPFAGVHDQSLGVRSFDPATGAQTTNVQVDRCYRSPTSSRAFNDERLRVSGGGEYPAPLREPWANERDTCMLGYDG